MNMHDEETVDVGRQEIIELDSPSKSASPFVRFFGASQGASVRPIQPWIAVAAVVVAVIGIFWWRSAAVPARVALAVPSGSVDAARTALGRAGIAAEFRDGALWVTSEDARRAADLALPHAATNAVATALEDESIFASSESSRSRRLAATIKTLEATIALQPGVERASVVLADPPRSFAPGGSSGATASVTVAMRSGSMPQDLVDAVALLVSGACPGVRPESISIIDAVPGRVRVVRNASERANAERVRNREEHSAELMTAVLADIPGVIIRVRESESGATIATVELPRTYAIAGAELETGGDLVAFLTAERFRIADRVEPFMTAATGVCAVSVTLAAEQEQARVFQPLPSAGYSAINSARVAVDASALREQETPLGSSQPLSGFPFGWAMIAAFGVAALIWWIWRSPRSALPVANGLELAAVPDFDHEPLPGSEASEAVRGAPVEAGRLLGEWVDRGEIERAARLVVALDADAARTVLQALSVNHVQQVTGALGTLDAPTHQELSEAVRLFQDDLELLASSGYRDVNEAA